MTPTPGQIYSALLNLSGQEVSATVLVLTTSPFAPGFYHCKDTTTHKTFIVHADNLSPMPNIPSRFKEKHFQELAHVIGAALKAYPGYITVDPKPLAVETYARRFREAVEAKHRYNYHHSAIDEALFKAHGRDLSTSMDENKIHIGSLDSLKSKGKLGVPQVRTQAFEVDASKLDALCLLISSQAFHPLPCFVTTGITAERIAELENRYEVGFVPFDDDPSKHQIV